MIRIHLTSVFVDDQAKAQDFYTRVLGFETRQDIDLGGGNRWLTVGAPGDDAVELLLEPSGHRAVGPFRDALREDGIPAAQLAADDVRAEHERLVALGVEFTMPPTDMGPVTIAVLDDTCGNLIQLAQMAG
ncbi:VOC family protein [Demequina sp. SYSU T00192]|uniref:VOC family protein n=1 Tax=Demequina litoralis TaxID=3051660 RepID=A0ABT8G9Y0_9MICO|nr:VOC family protein [Demequina sp. SYSU T00192]MDN4475949.1 VOC family protein [Demequina sp. SYSU T00192]